MSELTISAIVDAGGAGCVSVTAASSGACSGPGGPVPGASTSVPLRSGRLSQRDGVHRAAGCAVVSDATISFVVLAAVVVVFVRDRLPVAIVAIGVALSLWATGVLDLGQALDGFGDPAVLFIGALFVVSEALDATGVTAWAGQELIDRVGREPAAADRPDDAARRRADGADQRQRRRRRAVPWSS